MCYDCLALLSHKVEIGLFCANECEPSSIRFASKWKYWSKTLNFADLGSCASPVSLRESGQDRTRQCIEVCAEETDVAHLVRVHFPCRIPTQVVARSILSQWPSVVAQESEKRWQLLAHFSLGSTVGQREHPICRPLGHVYFVPSQLDCGHDHLLSPPPPRALRFHAPNFGQQCSLPLPPTAKHQVSRIKLANCFCSSLAQRDPERRLAR